MKGTLYLVPTLLSDTDPSKSFPPFNTEIISEITDFIVEDAKNARRIIRKLIPGFSFEKTNFYLLNEHTEKQLIASFLKPAEEGRSIALLTDAGCPGIADPGSEVVLLAHKKNIPVKPLVGPSSILLAIMSSGLNGQNFAFHGYLPKERGERIKKIKEIERHSKNTNQTQVFIETPYRTHHLFEDILANCNAATLLGIAANLTCPDEFIRALPVLEWKNIPLQLKDREVVFLILA